MLENEDFCKIPIYGSLFLYLELPAGIYEYVNSERYKEIVHFLETGIGLKFCVRQRLLLSAKYVPCEKDICTSFPSVSKHGAFINDITCACLKLGAKTAPQTVKHRT